MTDKSHRPHHPNEHTPEESKHITDIRKINPNAGFVVLWVNLTQRGYTHSIIELYRVLKKQSEEQ